MGDVLEQLSTKSAQNKTLKQKPHSHLLRRIY